MRRRDVRGLPLSYWLERDRLGDPKYEAIKKHHRDCVRRAWDDRQRCVRDIVPRVARPGGRLRMELPGLFECFPYVTEETKRELARRTSYASRARFLTQLADYTYKMAIKDDGPGSCDYDRNVDAAELAGKARMKRVDAAYVGYRLPRDKIVQGYRKCRDGICRDSGQGNCCATYTYKSKDPQAAFWYYTTLLGRVGVRR